ncbi:ABC transporter permease [Marinosulfonomonas sp. PRT-SC04]|nr:ABC transporter permease [Marinosulfonomonas sp. PRT-SC04]
MKLPTTATLNARLNLSAGVASVGVAIILVALKLWAFSETQALSIAASLTDSALDFIVSLGALAAIYYAARPADEDHAFGHTSAEDLAALAQSVFILISGGVIAWAAIRRLLSDTPVTLMAEGRGMLVMAISIALTLALILWQRYVARKTGSRVVAADSLHYLGDLLPAAGALLSLWASSQFDLTYIDSVVALGAAALLAIGALRIGKGAWDALMDRSASPAFIAKIEAITREHPGVHGFHDLRTRQSGSTIFVNLHVELDGTQTLNAAHAISADLKHAIRQTYPQCDVIIHQDPVRD